MDDGYHYGKGYIHTLYGVLAGKEDQGVQDWVGEGNHRAYSVIKKYEKSKGLDFQTIIVIRFEPPAGMHEHNLFCFNAVLGHVLQPEDFLAIASLSNQKKQAGYQSSVANNLQTLHTAINALPAPPKAALSKQEIQRIHEVTVCCVCLYVVF